MQKYINTLKSKTESERKQIAFVGAITCTALVFGIWVYTLSSKSSVQAQAPSDSKPFALLGGALKDTYNNITASIGSAKSVSDTMKTSATTEIQSEKVIPLIPVESQSQ
jgi:hypothetical protein